MGRFGNDDARLFELVSDPCPPVIKDPVFVGKNFGYLRPSACICGNKVLRFRRFLSIRIIFISIERFSEMDRIANAHRCVPQLGLWDLELRVSRDRG